MKECGERQPNTASDFLNTDVYFPRPQTPVSGPLIKSDVCVGGKSWPVFRSNRRCEVFFEGKAGTFLCGG